MEEARLVRETGFAGGEYAPFHAVGNGPLAL